MNEPHWCHQACGEQILRGLHRVAIGLGGDPVGVEMAYTAPLIMDVWWTGYECPHGNAYWFHPTAAQIRQWETDGTA